MKEVVHCGSSYKLWRVLSLLLGVATIQDTYSMVLSTHLPAVPSLSSSPTILPAVPPPNSPLLLALALIPLSLTSFFSLPPLLPPPRPIILLPVLRLSSLQSFSFPRAPVHPFSPIISAALVPPSFSVPCSSLFPGPQCSSTFSSSKLKSFCTMVLMLLSSLPLQVITFFLLRRLQDLTSCIKYNYGIHKELHSVVFMFCKKYASLALSLGVK